MDNLPQGKVTFTCSTLGFETHFSCKGNKTPMTELDDPSLLFLDELGKPAPTLSLGPHAIRKQEGNRFLVDQEQCLLQVAVRW